MDNKHFESLIDNAETKVKESDYFSPDNKRERVSNLSNEDGFIALPDAMKFNNDEMENYIAIFSKYLLEELETNGYLINLNDSRSMRDLTKRIMQEQEHILSMRKRGLAGY